MPIHAEVIEKAFRSELEKIAFVRSGRKPIGIDRLLGREAESTETPSNAFTDTKVSPEEFKADVEKVSASMGAYMAAGGIGALGLAALQRANRDRKMGKQMRLQSQGQNF